MSKYGKRHMIILNASIMVHIRNLRKKLGDTIQGGKYIKNIWGRVLYRR